ncbi:hypothetical protein BDV19DRAFT_384580 [Aspergillus venezuelensis]
MVRPPDSVRKFFRASPRATVIDYVDELSSSTPESQATFIPSLRDRPDNRVVTIAELRAAKRLAPKILLLDEQTVVKVGWNVRMGEAETLLLVEENTSVPVPKMTSAYTIDDIGFIVMSRVEGGGMLGHCWKDLSTEQFDKILAQLKGYGLQWRELKDSHIWHWAAPPRDFGPFQSLDEWKNGITDAVPMRIPRLIWGFLLMETCIGNIMIHNGSVSGIIDWAESGYSLPEREYFGAMRIAFEDDWIQMIPRFVPEYVEEIKLWDEVDRSMRRYSPV